MTIAKAEDASMELGRRDLLKTAAFTAAATALLGAEQAARAATPRPNILYILADDLGFADIGYRGSDIATPNIDRLAAGGLKLEQFYTQPMCTPMFVANAKPIQQSRAGSSTA